MRARAASTRATRDEILMATIALAYELERVDFSLEQVAGRAGRSVQTVLRHFGSRDALLEAAIQRGVSEVAAERRPPDGDPEAALDLLVAHYEKRGRFSLRLLAMGVERDAATVTIPGRQLHRSWVDEVFADAIQMTDDAREAVVDMLVVVTDVYAWKLLRLDRGLGASVVRERMGDMVQAILRSARSATP
jgi:AcrR family transcriptional regulator